MPYIFYDGIGAKESTIDSIEEFLNIMNVDDAKTKYYEMKYLGFDMEYKNYTLPDDYSTFTLADWLDYTGAIYYDMNW